MVKTGKTTGRWLLFLAWLLLGSSCGQEAPVDRMAELPPRDLQPTRLQPTPLQQTPLPPTAGNETAETTGSGNADVRFVRAIETAPQTWTFHVTVAHPDTGWADYADGWDVLLPDGVVLLPAPDASFTRLLTHPHENEQPFTRSQSGLFIPAGVTEVTVRAHDLVDGWGGQEVVVPLATAVTTASYEVVRLEPE